MNWTIGELVWLGSIAAAAVMTLAAGAYDMRRPVWQVLGWRAKAFHVGGMALVAFGLAAMVAKFCVMNGNG